MRVWEKDSSTVSNQSFLVVDVSRKLERFAVFSQELPPGNAVKPASQRTETGFGNQNNWAGVLLRQVHKDEPLPDNFLLCYSKPRGNDKRAPAAFVEDTFVIMGLMATCCHLIAAAAAFSCFRQLI